MIRILISAIEMIQSKEDLSSKLSISNKSKTIKESDKKEVKIKNEDNQQDECWNITDLLSNIFVYVDHKDLIEFNTVCKKWNYLTSPIIHKTIRLDSKPNGAGKSRYNRINNAVKIDADVVECISNNAKHAHLVKEFKFNYKLKPQRAVEVFETFRFIVNLTIEDCDMNQEQFLGMISPLTQLKELTIKCLRIKRIVYKGVYKEVVQLPPTLKKLKMKSIYLINNPELFIEAINSHSNLVEFTSNLYTSNEFLEPFYKHYPSLLNFEFNNNELQTLQSLFTVFEHNPQLVSLKLSLKCWSSELISNINSYLINLEELKLSENGSNDTDFIVKFSIPTKIKNLNLEWNKLSNCSLNSILQNCPHLEDLTLNRSKSYTLPVSKLSINLFKPHNIKRLNIICDNISGCEFDSLLVNFPHLNELSIKLPFEWKEAIKSIYEKCNNLERLNIYSSNQVSGQELDIFYQEFYESEFFTSNSKCKSTLKHLTLHEFKAHEAKSEYFKNFEMLKSIKYPNQRKVYHYSMPKKLKLIWIYGQVIRKFQKIIYKTMILNLKRLKFN
ncbi:hypothetical protein CONCODRAFT_12725 [Conidiobolus coronatus NRRL 28638]|uniref:F-box domain-containing protein n=1 Tax=Conidiobolus coronatus (strain ATCC 28846 / CBS 209.66 / NRRL 28638) TaxID=796925 RepID=A0A137NS91_CONC2|nr:hypothetical protein CONCODRAFT_12725 [Conidiobolus coronatus NRRL 28638]|eukprot:KXN65621.1 hypothetical protein CONCODRAFT_12725 [Conidiobolus coronatus NRRL 28638]